MKRTERLKEKIKAVISENQRPSVQGLADELGWAEEDVHRCLNSMEKKGEVETYVKEIFGRKNRFVSLKR